MRLTINQQIRELLAYFIVVDDVRLDIDVVGRSADGGKHCSIGCWAVLQQGHRIADHEWAADDGLFERNLLVEDVEVAGLVLSPATIAALCLAEIGPHAFSKCAAWAT